MYDETINLIRLLEELLLQVIIIMAGFQRTGLKHDDYMTPRSAWENIKQFIPKDKLIWEPFYGDGTSGKILAAITGNEVIHMANADFFERQLGEIIISNPPFSKKKEVFARLKELDKPFIMICPSSMLNTQYIRKLFCNDEDPLQIIIPRKRIQFLNLMNGEIPEDFKPRCNFDCFYYCWKIGLERDITWME